MRLHCDLPDLLREVGLSKVALIVLIVLIGLVALIVLVT